MDLSGTFLISAGILEIILGFAVLLRNKRNQTNLSFASFSFALAAWILGIALFRNAVDPDLALIWSKIYYIAGVVIAASLLYFACIFPEEKYLTYKVKLLIIIPTFLHIILISFPSYLTRKILIRPSGNDIVLGTPEYLIYTFYFLPILCAALYVLWSKYKVYSGVLKSQIMLVLISTFATSIFGVIFDLILPWLGNYKLIYIGPSFTVVIFLALSYAILRNKLWDFKLVFARVVMYSLLVGIIIGLYSLCLYFVSTILLRDISKNQILLFSGPIVFILILAFQPLKKAIEERTDKIFFRKNYDSNELLSKLGRIMSTNIELYSMARDILQVMLTDMRITRGAFILLDKDTIYEVIDDGFTVKPQYQYKEILHLIQKENILVFDEIPEDETKQIMRELNITVVKRLEIKNNIIGLLVLGEKSSGETYSDQDKNVVDILAPEVVVAIQNAESYDKIRRFNITLSEEVKKATFDLQSANSRLQELDKLKDDFVSVASHELRTPMTAIRSYVWMALNRPDITLSEKMRKYLSRTLISTERLINLVNDMLNVSRIESGRVEITPSSFDIRKLADDVILDVLPKIQEKNIKINVSKESLPNVFADQEKVHQVLMNLLGNALKFTPQEGSININFFTDGKVLETIVKDSGVGISKEDLSRLFTKFGRLDNSYVAAATSGGTGLGLYIAKSLIDLMGGKIWASSEGSGKGASFTFSLPIATPSVLAQAHKYTHQVPEGQSKTLEPVAI